MPLLPQRSSRAISTEVADRRDPTLPAILEFQSPSTAIVNAPMPAFARRVPWTIASMVVISFAITGIIKIDKVVTTPGRVIAQAATLSVQTLDSSIIRSIEVKEGDHVQAGQVLARLDPTFAAADLGALAAQVSTLQAQVARFQSEMENRPFTYAGLDPNLSLQAAIFAQRQAEYNFKLETYKQKSDSMAATIIRARSDITAYRDRVSYARTLEQMRKELERLNVGSKINTLAAMDSRVEMQRNLDMADQNLISMERDLAGQMAERDGYVQSWHVDIAEKLSEATGKLSDAREALNKAQLRRQLVELRADRDATVLTVGKVSVGSVLTAGAQVFSLVPDDAPLELEVNIPGSENGYVHVGDSTNIKFDTLPYTQYGSAHGVVRTISPDSFTLQDEQRNPSGSVPAGDRVGMWYRARITIDRLDLHDTPENFKLTPGMPANADILVGKRTVLSYFLGRTIPLFREGMREP